ncbi:hypothetical protein BDN72DRAFT_835147, partial [Pluteus cervinus]
MYNRSRPGPSRVAPLENEESKSKRIHKLFKTEGVLHEILYHLSPPVNSSSDVLFVQKQYKAPADEFKSTLLSAALTCRTFREPALDALWRTLDSFLPLCALIPSSGEGSQEVVGDL